MFIKVLLKDSVNRYVPTQFVSEERWDKSGNEFAY